MLKTRYVTRVQKNKEINLNTAIRALIDQFQNTQQGDPRRLRRGIDLYFKAIKLHLFTCFDTLVNDCYVANISLSFTFVLSQNNCYTKALFVTLISQ